MKTSFMVRHLHRNAGDMSQFARSFIEARLRGFEKDMGICLTCVPWSEARSGSGLAYAYFPALSTCCSMLEYLTALYIGRLSGVGHRQVSQFAAKYLPQPDYDEDTIRVLVEAFRHTVNHRGIATGVWLDKGPAHRGRRIVWRLLEGQGQPAVQIREEQGEIVSDSPWPCRYTHRTHIHLTTLRRDILVAGQRYAADFGGGSVLESNFVACMRRLYP